MKGLPEVLSLKGLPGVELHQGLEGFESIDIWLVTSSLELAPPSVWLITHLGELGPPLVGLISSVVSFVSPATTFVGLVISPVAQLESFPGSSCSWGPGGLGGELATGLGMSFTSLRLDCILLSLAAARVAFLFSLASCCLTFPVHCDRGPYL